MSIWNPYDSDIPWGPFDGPCSEYITGANPAGLAACMQDTQAARIAQAVRASSQERVACAIRKCSKYSKTFDQFRCVVHACDEVIANPGPISAFDKALCALLGGTELPTQPGVAKASGISPVLLVGGGLLAAWLLLGKKRRNR
jgi:hypothetical protein